MQVSEEMGFDLQGFISPTPYTSLLTILQY